MSHDDLDDNRKGSRHRGIADDVDAAASNDRPDASASRARVESRGSVVVPLGRARKRRRPPGRPDGPENDDPGPKAA